MGGCLCLLLKSGSDFTPICKHRSPHLRSIHNIFPFFFRGLFVHVLTTTQGVCVCSMSEFIGRNEQDPMRMQ
jgi:hypothetical protein